MGFFYSLGQGSYGKICAVFRRPLQFSFRFPFYAGVLRFWIRQNSGWKSAVLIYSDFRSGKICAVLWRPLQFPFLYSSYAEELEFRIQQFLQNGILRRWAQSSDLKMSNRNDCFIPVRYIEGLSFRIYRFQEGFVTQLGSDLGHNNDQTECLIHPFSVYFGMLIPPMVPTPVFFYFFAVRAKCYRRPGARSCLPSPSFLEGISLSLPPQNGASVKRF